VLLVLVNVVSHAVMVKKLINKDIEPANLVVCRN